MPEASDPETPDALRDEMRLAWFRYLDLVVPLRPVLHGYCRRLARDLWDAEDLVQDTLLRAFAHLGRVNHTIRNPRAYLLRTATNVWIDELRRRERAPLAEPEESAASEPASESCSDARSAGARLFQRLSPQERAAVVLREMFEMSFDEIADLLATTPGAVKTALHRGRERLRAPDSPASGRRPAPSPELLDRWLERWREKDLPGLAALMLDGATVENVGEAQQTGRETFLRTQRNILWHVVHGHAEWPKLLQPDAVRMERHELDGEPLVLAFVRHGDREALQTAFRFEESDGRIARLRIYGFCPETMREVGARLGVPVLTGLYHAPLPPPGGWEKPQGG